jgi:hypothetical protein
MIVDIERDQWGFRQAIITVASSTELAMLTVLLQNDIENKLEMIENTNNDDFKNDLLKSLDKEVNIFLEFIENKENNYPELFARINYLKELHNDEIK